MAPGEDRWHSRGYLPHFDAANAVQHVVFRLADSLPAEAVARIDSELRELPADRIAVERRRRVEAWLDASHGNCLLAQPDAARLVESSLLHFDGQRYRLLAWVVMPNHVHAVMHTLDDWSTAAVVSSWKHFTGRRLAHASPVWCREYWDRYVRDDRHFGAVVRYVHRNPVAAGLVDRAGDWPFSSAGRHLDADGTWSPPS